MILLIIIINIICFIGLVNWVNNEKNKENNDFSIKQAIFLIFTFPFGTAILLFCLLFMGLLYLIDVV